MLSVLAEHPIYIIMDALDECPDNSGWPKTPREEVLDVVKDLVGLHLPNLHICVTSRPEVDIKSVLNQLTIHAVSLHDQSGQQKDIADYVSTVVNSDRKMRNGGMRIRNWLSRSSLKERTECKGVASCSTISFLSCIVQVPMGILPAGDPAAFFATKYARDLSRLPKTLDETYERVLRDIPEDNKEHARRLLHCLAVAVRPLRVEELAEILAFDFDMAQGGIPKYHADWRWKDQEEAVLSTCSSLIAIVDNDGSLSGRAVFSLLRQRVLDVESPRILNRRFSRYHILPEPAHTILAQACLGFLLHLDDHVDRQRVKGFPLAGYAAQHWVAHAQFEDVASRVKDGMQSLFDPTNHISRHGSRTYIWTDSQTGLPNEIPNPLYYAALCGFRGPSQHLVSNHPQLVNAIGGCFGLH